MNALIDKDTWDFQERAPWVIRFIILPFVRAKFATYGELCQTYIVYKEYRGKKYLVYWDFRSPF